MVVNKSLFYRFLLILLMLIFLVESVYALEDNEQIINMNFKETEIADVLRAIAELAEINLVIDGSVGGTVTVQLKNITFNKALNLITQAHNLDYHWENDTVVVATPERIEKIYGEVITESVKVDYAELEDLSRIVSGVYFDLTIQIAEHSRELIIKGNKEKICEAVKLIKRLDTQNKEVPPEKVIEILKLSYADIDNMIVQIKGIYPDLNLQGDKTNNQLIILGCREEVDKGLSLVRKLDIAPEEKVETVKIKHSELSFLSEQIMAICPELKLSRDEINRQLIIAGKKSKVEQAGELVKRLDIPKDEITEIVQIEYLELEKVREKITAFYPDLQFELNAADKLLFIRGRSEEVNAAVLLAENLNLLNRRFTELVRVDYLDLEELKTIIQEFHPTVTLQLNNLKKEFIINGREDDLKEVLKLVERLDRPRRQVIIEARIEEISRTELSNIGVSADQLAQINFLKDDDGEINGLNVDWPDFIRALEDSGSANTLANPRLMTINGEEAKLLIGDRIPVEVEHVEDGKPTKTIEFIDAGITLEFVPWITSDNQIILDVKPKVSSIGESIGTAIPPINTREAETKIRLQDGQTFAIGGLIQDDVIENISKVPLLSDIPIFGELFKHKKLNNIKTEVIIFITPHIVKENEEEFIKEDGKDKEDTKEEEVLKKESETAIEMSKIEKKPKVDFEGLTFEEIDSILTNARAERNEKR